MVNVMLAPFRFAYAIATGFAFVSGLFVWTMLGAACAGAVVLGAVLVLFFGQTEALWLVVFGMIAGGIWSMFTDAFANLMNG